MTDIEQKALALLNEVAKEMGLVQLRILDTDLPGERALCRAIEQHEAFKREVSDAVERAVDDCGHDGLRKAYVHARFFHFILPKTDPLVEAWLEAFPGNHIDDAREECAKINAALAARGLTITETKE
jgi:hypothetical protein